MATKRRSAAPTITADKAPIIAQIAAPLPHNLTADLSYPALEPQLVSNAIRNLHELTARLADCAERDDRDEFVVEFDRSRKLVRSLEPAVQSFRYKWAEVCAVRLNLQIEFRGMKYASHHELLYEVCRERIFVVWGAACPAKFRNAIAGIQAEFDAANIQAAWRDVRRIVRKAGIFDSSSNDILPLLSAELGAITHQSDPPAGEVIATFLGDGRYRVGETLITLVGTQAEVLQALVELQSGSLDDLETRSGGGNPSATLTRICKSHPLLAAHIKLPGGKGKGGYSTSIIDGTKQPEATGSK